MGRLNLWIINKDMTKSFFVVEHVDILNIITNLFLVRSIFLKNLRIKRKKNAQPVNLEN